MTSPVSGQPRAAAPLRLVDDHHTMPALEPWLRVMLIALVPALSIMFVPDSLQRPMAGAAGVLLTIGGCILLMQVRKKRRGGRATR